VRYKILAVLLILVSSSPFAAAYFFARDPSAPIILSPPFGLHSRHAYAARVDFVTSEVAVYENGLRLGPADSSEDDICLYGNGRYLFREIDPYYHVNGIIFSSSDNTDPNTNGRLYRVYLPNAKDPRNRAPSGLLKQP
jgi:hypothetical protein